MAQAKRKIEWNAGARPATPGTGQAMPGTTSPARALQQLLEERTGVVPGEQRWSRRRSVAFVVSLSTTLWMVLLALTHNAMTILA